jgi:hypothetical protein
MKNDVHAALQSPSLQEQFAREGASAVEMSSAAFGKYRDGNHEMGRSGREEQDPAAVDINRPKLGNTQS